MTEQLTIAPVITLEQAIQTVIHDLRIPKKLRTALAVYQGLWGDPINLEIGMPRGPEQTQTTCLSESNCSSLAGVCQLSNSQNATCVDRNILNCEGTVVRQEIKLTCWHNDESRDWSIEINGLRHEHVTSDVMEALVECALIHAQMSLTKLLGLRPQ
jgi:hypothetical protein